MLHLIHSQYWAGKQNTKVQIKNVTISKKSQFPVSKEPHAHLDLCISLISPIVKVNHKFKVNQENYRQEYDQQYPLFE